ncbi:MAG: tRNA (adenosine(37)-N6)-threonylcarbamoyltransferase complex ATPase subunit type 1 TsaE [Candidatus Puniceispirillaceae bacterium]
MRDLTIYLQDPAATARLGLLLSAQLRAGDVVALEGMLGAGKSVLARAVISTLCPQEDDIPSPTFTLVQTYEPDNMPMIMHFDLYRLDTAKEALELGIEDAFIDAVSLVEWPQRLGGYLPRTALTIALSDGDSDTSRRAKLHGGARWQPLLEALAGQFRQED